MWEVNKRPDITEIQYFLEQYCKNKKYSFDYLDFEINNSTKDQFVQPPFLGRIAIDNNSIKPVDNPEVIRTIKLYFSKINKALSTSGSNLSKMFSVLIKLLKGFIHLIIEGKLDEELKVFVFKFLQSEDFNEYTEEMIITLTKGEMANKFLSLLKIEILLDSLSSENTFEITKSIYILQNILQNKKDEIKRIDPKKVEKMFSLLELKDSTIVNPLLNLLSVIFCEKNFQNLFHSYPNGLNILLKMYKEKSRSNYIYIISCLARLMINETFQEILLKEGK